MTAEQHQELGHLLVIDDDADFAAICLEIFEKLGLFVTVASSIEEGERILRDRGPEIDVILLDQRSKSDKVGDLIAYTKARAPFAKIIVIAGYATPEAIEQALAQGAYDHIMKDSAFFALIRTKVRNAIEIAHALRVLACVRQRAS